MIVNRSRESGHESAPLHKERRALLNRYDMRRNWVDRPSDNVLQVAQLIFLVDAVRAFLVDLPEIAQDYLTRARSYLDRVVKEGPQPSLGFDPSVHGIYWDDEELDYHWSITFRTRYLVDLLLTGHGNAEDLTRAMMHIERLSGKTKCFTGPTERNKVTILCDYMLSSLFMRRPQTGLEMAEPHLLRALKPTSVVRKYLRDPAHLDFLVMVARFAGGQKEYERGVRSSFGHLMDAHTDFEHDTQRLCWAGPLYSFDWAWTWETVFEATPCVRRAIDIMRGDVKLGPVRTRKG